MTASQAGEELVSMAFPGPWWTSLTYVLPRGVGAASPGARARAPMGKGSRVGIVTPRGVDDDGYSGRLREITEVIDETPALSHLDMDLLRWFCDAYLCGFGTAIKTLLPASFFDGEPIDPPRGERGGGTGGASFVYDPLDAGRFERYAAMLSDGARSLVSFPLYSDAKRFFAYFQSSAIVPDDVKRRAALYPKTSGTAEWRMWRTLRAPDDDSAVVVGGQNSAMAPLSRVARFIVDDESNNVWRTMRHPVYNVRSLIAARARIEGASLVLGGRMPSARAFMRCGEAASPSAAPRAEREKIIFVDMKLAYTPSVEGVVGGLAVSEPLVRETEAALSRGEWAIWILDRKGYAGEIICEECNAPFRCAKCGGATRLESDRVRCLSCGADAPVPDECPNCAGRLLSARRPGLDALISLADAAVVSPAPILGPSDREEEVRRRIKESPSGVMLGTRALLELCDEVRVGMVGWIDADGEARSEEHNAKQRAFSLIWESRWRGLSPLNRRVLLQTRRPASDWQAGLDRGGDGWRTFWRRELRDRRELSMPPFSSLVRAEGAARDIERLYNCLSDGGYECWAADEDGGKSVLWIRTRKLSALRRALVPFFHIERARRGYPSVTVWHE